MVFELTDEQKYEFDARGYLVLRHHYRSRLCGAKGEACLRPRLRGTLAPVGGGGGELARFGSDDGWAIALAQ